MKFRIIWVGKTRDRNWLALEQDYLGRLRRFVDCTIVEIRSKGSRVTRRDEGNRILERVNPRSLVCTLDIKGESIGSRELAKKIAGWQMNGPKEITFVIGGADGLSSAVDERADYSLSLSFLTFTHEMARVLLLEQLYRAFTIIKGYPYQK